MSESKVRKHPAAICEECPLYEAEWVRSQRPDDAKVAFVSRSPGRYDVEAMKPFGGPSGRVLNYLLNSNGVERHDVLTTNVVMCKTDEPPQEALRCCAPRLEEEIANCTTIIAAGREAAGYLAKAPNVKANRGFDHHRTSITGVDQRVIVTTNPAVVLRESGTFPDMVRDMRLALNPRPQPEFPKVWLINDLDEYRSVFTSLFGSFNIIPGFPIASDLETYGYTPKIACAGFSFDGNLAYVLGDNIVRRDEVYADLKELYTDTAFTWLWHNGKYDVKQLRANGIPARVDEDTLLLSYACDERPGPEGIHALDYLLMEEFSWPNYEPKSVKDFKSNKGWYEDDRIEFQKNELYKYNGWDTAGTWQLYPLLTERAKNDLVNL